MSEPFDPDWVVKPGETLKEFAEENNLPLSALATACNLTPGIFEDICNGVQPITPYLAGFLQAGTGIPASLWLNLEKAYRAGLAAGKKEV